MTGSFTLLLGCIAAVFVLSCSAARQDMDYPVPVVYTVTNPLFVSPDVEELLENPDLRSRLFSSPHGYFRWINEAFTRQVCVWFPDLIEDARLVNLHGDAHLEQYAITTSAYGLADFDDAFAGPAAVDLLRLGASISLACEAHGWSDEYEAVMYSFRDGYSLSLRDPEAEPAEPAVVQRIRATFSNDPEVFYSWVQSLLHPLSEDMHDSLIAAMGPYVSTLCMRSPELKESYFDEVECGWIQMGIGSAAHRKYLVRIQGSTSDSLDDVILECKEVQPLGDRGCNVSTPLSYVDPFRILVSEAQISRDPPSHAGYFRFNGIMFRVLEWDTNYKELDIQESFMDVQELKELTFDIGMQLGRGHLRNIAAPFNEEARREQLAWIERNFPLIIAASGQMYAETMDAWRLFTAAVKTSGE